MNGKYEKLKAFLGRTEPIHEEHAADYLIQIEEKLEESVEIEMIHEKDGWTAVFGPTAKPTHKGMLVVTGPLPKGNLQP